METKEIYDKSNWRKGEWDNEPDRVDFVSSGFACFIRRNSSGNWCGYVGIPETHSLYEKNYNDVDVEVHGGLTYSDKCSPPICHTPVDGMPNNVWWLGFDTAHYGDLTPSSYHPIHREDIYRNMAYVINETKNLAKQLERME